MVDFVVEDLSHEGGRFGIAMAGEGFAVEGRKVKVGLLEGKAHGADVADGGSCDVGDMGPKVLEEGKIAEFDAES